MRDEMSKAHQKNLKGRLILLYISQAQQKRNQVIFFLLCELRSKDEIEELDRICQGEQSAIVQIRW